jgi:ribulose-phosphate 3-epimerase
MILAPSILSADLADLRSEVGRCEAGGADRLHVDVMDGHFVPNLTFGLPVVEALRRVSTRPLDVHLMIDNPDSQALAYAEAGAFQVIVHWEAARHLHRLLAALRERGVRAGVAINPATPVAALDQVLDWVDHVLVMSVNPGFSGQSFIPEALDKARQLRRAITSRGLAVEIGMDGGVSQGNIREIVAAGVESCVAGSAVFAQGDPETALRQLRLTAISEKV